MKKLSSLFLMLSCLIIASFWSCNADKTPSAPTLPKHDIKVYYFPIEDLFEGKVYIYTAVNDSLPPYFGYFKNNGGYLTSTYYDYNFKVEQITNETVVKSGTLMNRIQLCQYNETEPDICQVVLPTIEYDNVFPFQVSDSSGVFLYKVKWNDAIDSTLEYEVLRNKHFLGFTNYTYKDKVYKCVKFGIREETKVGSEQTGYQTFKAYTEEIYAKNLGLVYYKKNIDNVRNLEYQLTDIISMEALENMFSNAE